MRNILFILAALMGFGAFGQTNIPTRQMLADTNGVVKWPTNITSITIGGQTFTNLTGFGLSITNGQLAVDTTQLPSGGGGDAYLDNSQTFTGANTFSGPVTISGPLTISTQTVDVLNIGSLGLGTNIVGLANGGTSATNAAGARTALGIDSAIAAAVSDAAYDATSWNGDTGAASKNALRDKFESMGSGGSSPTFENSILTWSSTNTINLSTNAHRTLVLGGDTTFETGTVTGGARVLVLCYNDQATNCALVFPGQWQFFNVSMPTTLAAGKRGLLSLSTFGTASTNVMATYGATP